eukprot:NODE_17_length_48642_cov_1.199349.p9 type:complete len:421 gc:universal NODE_17_length_48642_cov_1.199349:24433-23171(-)
MLSMFRFRLMQKPIHQIINMPALSPTMTQGNISEWRKKIGDQLSPGDILAEIETDKANMEFEFQDDGFLAKTFFEDGSKDIKVGTAIAVLCESLEDVEKFKDFEAPKDNNSSSKGEKQPTQVSPEPSLKKEASTKTIKETKQVTNSKASPLVKKLASLEKIKIENIKGSGPNGRVVLNDYIKFKGSSSISKPNFTEESVSQMRKTIASRLTDSKANIPHYYLTSKVNVDKLVVLRRSLKEQSISASINDFVNKATALTLRDHSEVNCSWMGDYIRKYNSVDLSMAVATEKGLITPIIRNADKLGLTALNELSKTLAEKAKNSQLKPEDYQGGSFCVSNLGMYGIDQFNAIINPPQSGILAVAGIKNEVAIVMEGGNEKIVPTRILTLTASFDHRIVDGAVGATFMKTLKSYLENPLTLLK